MSVHPSTGLRVSGVSHKESLMQWHWGPGERSKCSKPREIFLLLANDPIFTFASTVIFSVRVIIAE
jgi:hypothetical protein